MHDERTPELAEFEADLRRTREELDHDDIPDLSAIVRRKVRDSWEEREGYARAVGSARRSVLSEVPADEAQFIADLRRTRDELTDSALDIDSIVANGARAYWERRQFGSSVPASAPDAVPATAAMLRDTVSALSLDFEPSVPAPAAALSRLSSRPIRQLFLGFLVVIVTIVGFSIILAPTTDVAAPLLRITGPRYVFDQHMQFAEASLMILFVVFAAMAALYRHPVFRRWSVIMGSVAGCAVLAIWGIAYVDASKAVGQVEELGTREILMSLEQSERSMEPVFASAGIVPLPSAKLSEAGKGFRGELVGRVSSPRAANLEWHVGDDVVNRTQFVVGWVRSVEDGKTVVLSSDQELRLPLKADRVPAPGQYVVAEVDPAGNLEWWYPASSSATFTPLLRRQAVKNPVGVRKQPEAVPKPD
ncbi:MAG TPA: hypothetical protein VF432_07075 [Thermoanaerobaculia bacterium]